MTQQVTVSQGKVAIDIGQSRTSHSKGQNKREIGINKDKGNRIDIGSHDKEKNRRGQNSRTEIGINKIAEPNKKRCL